MPRKPKRHYTNVQLRKMIKNSRAEINFHKKRVKILSAELGHNRKMRKVAYRKGRKK